jgi:hypothetical protein
MGARRGRRVPEPSRLTVTPFWAELQSAGRGVAGAKLEDRGGYGRVTLVTAAPMAGISARARELLEAHPPDAEGRRTIVIDVRNRQWLALASELLAAAR